MLAVQMRGSTVAGQYWREAERRTVCLQQLQQQQELQACLYVQDSRV